MHSMSLFPHNLDFIGAEGHTIIEKIQFKQVPSVSIAIVAGLYLHFSELEKGGKSQSFPKTREILKEIGVKNVSEEDCLHVAYICTVVSTRAAYLIAAGIAQVLNRMKRPYPVTVGVDGSVFRFHPHVKHLMHTKIGELVDKGIEYKLMLSKDGSGIGAAVVAAVATRIKKEMTKSSSKSDMTAK